ncbi:hypothetical protein BSP109_03245 [Brevibacterium sp. Mu109]|uniref:hypothetical protein n=1 Tax=Brevibacterium TaxID=1696 RepID=UPI000B35A10B|nr:MULTISPECIES: hypothetical protein [Brevibacterium]SMY00890.1 hypothetical protein BSP109_03245 [Brevibacterium sp. Mu109]
MSIPTKNSAVTRRRLFMTGGAGAAALGATLVFGASAAQASDRDFTQFRTTDGDGGEMSNPANLTGCPLGRGEGE